MKTFKKFLPRPTDPDVAKTDAVFTVLALILFAYVIAFTVALVGPVVLSKILPGEATESTKTYVGLIILLITTALFALFSWDMVNDKVRSSIKADVAVKELENSEKEHFKRQDQELRSVAEYYRIIPSSNLALNKSLRSRMARDSIIEGLAYNDVLLRRICYEATKKVLNANDTSGSEASKNEVLTIFQQDIFIYLKLWLMQSIMNGRCMDILVVEQRCANKKPHYIKALTYVRDILIKKRQVIEKLKPEYKDDSIKMLEEYLSSLIKFLKENLKN